MRPSTNKIKINSELLPINGIIREKEKYSAWQYTYEKIGVSKICEKDKNGVEGVRRYKNVNLNKIQRSNECVAQDKESLERKNDSYARMVFKTKGPQIRYIPYGSLALSSM